MNPDAASAQSVSPHPRGTSSEAPHPGASHAMTSTYGLRRSSSPAQIRESSNAPWKSTSGAPLPCCRYAIRTPPTTTSAMVRGYAMGLAAWSVRRDPDSTAMESPGPKDGRWSHRAEQPPSTAPTPSWSISRTCRPTDIGAVGGKAANLGELIRAGFDVPPGFCVTTEAYRRAVRGTTVEAGTITDAPAARAAVLGAPFPEPVADAVRDAYARLDVRRRGAGRGAIVGHRGGPARRELRRPAGHLPQRRRHRRCARRRASLLGVALDRPGGRLPRRPGHRRLRGRAGRGRAADGGCRVGGRAVHGRPGDGSAAAGGTRRRARPRRRGGVRRRGPRPLRRRHRDRADPRPAARRHRPTRVRPA